MRKTLLTLLLASAYLISSDYSYASDSISLKVKGTLKIGACTPTVGSIDLGDIKVKDLPHDNDGVFNEFVESTTFNLVCPQPTLVGYTLLDDRSDTVATNTDKMHKGAQFGLGTTDANTNIGYYLIEGDSNKPVSINGINAPYVMFDDTGATGDTSDTGYNWVTQPSSGYTYSPTGHTLFSYSTTVSTVGPNTIASLSVPLKVTVSINGPSALNISDNNPIDGQATYTVVYL